MPAKFGSVVKAYITTDEQLSGKATGTVTKKSTDWMTKGKEGEKDISHKPEIVVGAYGGGRRRRAVTIGSTQQIQPAYIQQQMIDNISNAMDQYYFIQNYQGPGGTGGYADPSGNIGNATKILNHLALNLYVLTYDANKNFVALNTALNNNLENYLSQHRMLTDAINIKTPFIVNLGIEFEIIPTSAANNSDVLLRCISYLKSAFDNDKMSINQPLIITKYMSGLDKLEGVQTVSSFKFVNKYDTTSGYAGNVYTCNNATRNNILYPPVDPSIFEIKFPNKDIKGKIVSY
jgi:hypothetical protein